MRRFLEAERERIAGLGDSEDGWQDWCGHYRALSPEEQAVTRYLLTAAGKAEEAEDRLEEEFEIVSCVGQKDVNNGFGIMFSIDRACFPHGTVKLFYVRSDMCIPSEGDPDIAPQWISDLAEDCKTCASGLAKIRPEVIRFSFGTQPPCDHWAITFRLDAKQIRKSVRIGEERWWPRQIGPYLFTLLDITGEYDYAIGELRDDGPLVLWRGSIDFD